MKNIAEILSHLPENNIKELETITQRIINTGLPCMIILYGSFARGDWKDPNGLYMSKKSDYDILVLTKDERDCEDLKKRIEKMFDNSQTIVQNMVRTIGFVNMHLREKQYFFTEIKNQGKILYAEKNLTLAEAENLTATRLREIAELDFKQWYGQAKGFLKNAHFSHNENEYKLASFMIQQSVENCYTATEMVYSRNNPYEHRLTILRMNAKRYVPEIDQYFPLETKEEKDLFYHLDAAYIGGRYIDKEHYKVSKEQLSYWEKEAQKLLEITQKVCLKKIEDLKEKEKKS